MDGNTEHATTDKRSRRRPQHTNKHSAHHDLAPMSSSGAAAASASSAATLRVLESLQAKKAQLDDDLALVEKAILDGEESYLEESNHYGNVVKGWDGFLTSRPRMVTHSTHHGSKRSNITIRERVFSCSSTSAPVDNPLDAAAAADQSVEEMELMGGGITLMFKGDSRRGRASMAKVNDEEGDE